MKITHLWQDYSPNLFDKSHPLCLAHGFDSEVVCQAYIDNGAAPLPGTYYVRTRDPAESNSTAFASRIVRRIRRPIDNARFARLVRTRTDEFRPDVIHVHFGTTAAVLENYGSLPDQPIIVSFYGVDVSASLRDPDTIRAYRSVFSKASVLHVLCDEARDRLIVAGCPPEKLRIGNLPANLDSFADIGVDATNCTRFLIPARFVEKKGHVVLLKAFKRLLEDGRNIRLTCFGYGPAAWLERMVAELGLGDAVCVVDNGQTSNFSAEYVAQLRQHDIVLAPSIRSSSGDDEGGPALTLVMAQAAGKPVIVSDFPGSERSVADGKQGRVVPAGDADALYWAMEGLVDRQDLWQQFGRAGRQRVIVDFSDAVYWASLSDWYRTAIRARI